MSWATTLFSMRDEATSWMQLYSEDLQLWESLCSDAHGIGGSHDKMPQDSRGRGIFRLSISSAGNEVIFRWANPEPPPQGDLSLISIITTNAVTVLNSEDILGEIKPRLLWGHRYCSDACSDIKKQNVRVSKKPETILVVQ